VPFGTWTLEFMRSTCYFAQSLDFEELRIDFGCGLAGLVANYYYRTGCQAVGLNFGACRGGVCKIPRGAGCGVAPFRKARKVGRPGGTLKSGAVRTPTHSQQTRMCGAPGRLLRRGRARLVQSAPAIIGIKTTRWALCGRMRRRDGRHA
jgi:hypothetical protein